MVLEQVGHYRVTYVDGGKVWSFGVHTYDDAKWWAMFMRSRWRVPVYIEREHAAARRPEIAAEVR